MANWNNCNWKPPSALLAGQVGSSRTIHSHALARTARINPHRLPLAAVSGHCDGSIAISLLSRPLDQLWPLAHHAHQAATSAELPNVQPDFQSLSFSLAVLPSCRLAVLLLSGQLEAKRAAWRPQERQPSPLQSSAPKAKDQTKTLVFNLSWPLMQIRA